MAAGNRVTKIWYLMAFVCFVSMGPYARAGDIDPFQTDTGPWMSFQRYKDNVKRGLIIPPDNASSYARLPPARLPAKSTLCLRQLRMSRIRGLGRLLPHQHERLCCRSCQG